MARETGLKYLGELANILETADFVDSTSNRQKRALREAADGLRTSLEGQVGEVTPAVLFSFWAGAAMQADMAEKNALAQVLGAVVGESSGPRFELVAVIAYLARDLLAGERVE